MIRKISIALIALIVLSCEAPKEDRPKETMSSETVAAVEDYSFSTLVSKNGKIVLEAYYNGKTKDSLCDIQSLTKGLMSILIGIAIDKHYIKSIHEPIATYFPTEFQHLTDQEKRSITIQHLLNQTSGLSWKGYLEHEAWLDSENPIAFVLNKDLEHQPGTTYNYNSGATHLLSVIISRAYGHSTLDFANDFLLNDLNIETVDWQRHHQGFYDGSGLGLKMKPIDLMKIGQLLENNGQWKGRQLISKEWIQQLFNEQEKAPTEWGLSHSKHGFCWYHSELNGHRIDYGMGYGGQFLIMIPHKKLIIVATHHHDTPNGIEQQLKFLNTTLPKLIEQYGS